MSFMLPPTLLPPRYGESSGTPFSPLDLVPTWGFQASNISPTGGKVAQVLDESGAAHHINQTVDARRPAYTQDAGTGRYCIDFSSDPTTDQRLPFTTPWAQTNVYDVYAVIRFRESASDYQSFMHATGAGAGQSFPYLGSVSGNLNKPMLYAGAGTALWGSAIQTDDLIFVRWSANLTTDETSISVNDGTPVNGNQSVNLGSGDWQGISTAVAIQECISRIFEAWMFDYKLTALQNTDMIDYFTSKYGTPDS